jgi:hypothetical protein
MSQEILNRIEKRISPISRTAAILATLTGLGIAYVFFINNIYRPTVKVVSVNYDNGTAVIKSGKKEKILRAGSILSVGLGDWGVAFGLHNDKYDRIELVKNGLSYKILSTIEAK